ncbi:Baculoviral IAP repeat-containing protein 5.2-B [Acipenser ruthenus]|uniref:Baculoviral IAP repeat-containing protein 5.2-B n=1 Tax=Acipenser ruthenus TaxID=7906 RepID=A0A662Z044_ACIRT|nr:Baculoviral IAP repeat-containing protein 5.2-B [Acipenser ruthenus]
MIREEECKMYHLENRLKTYSGWPFTEGCVCTPENMAKAGFIHCPTENSPDVAQCFFCYKELEGWEPDDVPEQEHQRHSPACHFIALKKPVEELTLEELMKLQKERQKFLITTYGRLRSRMRMNLGRVVVLAGLSGIVSFSLLVSAIATDHWYILEVNDPNSTVDPGELNSHSGLWRTCEGNACYPLVYPFSTDTSKQPEPVRRLINMFKAVVILLPLSLVLLVFGGICGLVSSLSKSITLLVLTGSYFLLCTLAALSHWNMNSVNAPALCLLEMASSGFINRVLIASQCLLTLSGVSVYIIYSKLAFEIIVQEYGVQRFAHVHIAFGLSMAMAWLSFTMEIVTGSLLLLAAKITGTQQNLEATAGYSLSMEEGP